MKRCLPIIILILFSGYFLHAQQIENAGFEFWEDAGTVWDEPVDWSSIKTSDAGEIINGAAPAVWDKSTDHHSGEFSLELTNLAVLDIVAAGTITNGRVHADFDPELGFVFTDTVNSQWNTPCTARPDSLVGWFKFYPQGQDFGTVQALLHVNYAQLPEKVDSSDWIGYTKFEMQPGITVNAWTRFSVPFTYYDNRTPQYLLFVLTSGNGTTPVADGYALFDDLALVGGESAIADFPASDFTIFADKGKIILKNLPLEFLGNANVELIDFMGRVVLNLNLDSPEISFNANLIPEGIYIFRLSSQKSAITRKIYIR